MGGIFENVVSKGWQGETLESLQYDNQSCWTNQMKKTKNTFNLASEFVIVEVSLYDVFQIMKVA